MCAIAGIIRRAGHLSLEDRSLVARMTAAQAHRGPEGEGIWHDDRVSFGHRRLTILDLSDRGKQPMGFQGTPVVTYNGEIYNYIELRHELRQHGYVFRTNTDTEVLIYGCMHWGIHGLLDRLDGMFAFALWDGRTCYLARDHLGVKPLYYRIGADAILFASEVRVLQGAENDPAALSLFLQWGSVVAPQTTGACVLSLPAGCYATVDEHGMRMRAYWSLENAMREEAQTLALRPLLQDIITKQTRSDVHVALALSGGMDSSVLAYLLDRPRNYLALTIDTMSEDTPCASAVATALHMPHAMAPAEPLCLLFDELLTSMDQPSIDGLNTYRIAQLAQMWSQKVLLSGVGADEVFSGYRHQGMLGVLLGYRQFRKLFWPKDVARLLDADVKDCVTELFVPPSLTETQALTYLEYTHYLHDQLLRDADWASMAHGVEMRVPYLDHRLVEAILPFPKKRSLTRPKPLLLDAVPELPREVWDRPKQGFTLPMEQSLKQDADLWEDLATTEGPLNKKAVTAIWQRFRAGRMHWSRAWGTVIGSQWHRWSSAF